VPADWSIRVEDEDDQPPDGDLSTSQQGEVGRPSRCARISGWANRVADVLVRGSGGFLSPKRRVLLLLATLLATLPRLLPRLLLLLIRLLLATTWLSALTWLLARLLRLLSALILICHSYLQCRLYDRQVKPFGFLYALHADVLSGDTEEVFMPSLLDKRSVRGPVKPVSPYDKDLSKAIAQCFDRETGRPVGANILVAIGSLNYRSIFETVH
jgi:hypothetical protein